MKLKLILFFAFLFVLAGCTGIFEEPVAPQEEQEQVTANLDASPRIIKDGDATTLIWTYSGGDSAKLEPSLANVQTKSGTKTIILANKTESEMTMPFRLDVYKNGIVQAWDTASVLIKPATFVDTTLLSISSSPTGAAVYLNGTFFALTNTGDKSVTPGTYAVRLEKAGYVPKDTNVTVPEGQTVRLNFTLTPTTQPTTRLAVNSTPSGATVYLNSTFFAITNTGDRDVQPGTYAVRLEKQGYYPKDTSITVPEGQTVRMNVALAPITQIITRLAVNSNPTGATVYLNGAFFAATPTGDRDVTPGQYTVTMEKTGYHPKDTVVSVPEGQTVRISMSLIPITQPITKLAVSSVPTGASVYLDGNYFSQTNTGDMDVKPGQHALRLEKAGYISKDTTVSVPSGQTVRISLTLTPVTSPVTKLSVTSVPTGANAYVDGAFFAATPTGYHNVAPGQHTLKLEKTGYVTKDTTISVPEGQSVSVNVNLTAVSQPITRLSISSSPTGAAVYLNGTFFALTNTGDKSVTPGTYAVRLEKAGYVPKDTNVTVPEGQTVRLNFTLTPTTQPTTRLAVNSTPSGATVYLNSTFFAITNTGDRDVQPGTYAVRLEKQGYYPKDTSITVPEGQTVRMNVALVAIPPFTDSFGPDYVDLHVGHPLWKNIIWADSCTIPAKNGQFNLQALLHYKRTQDDMITALWLKYRDGTMVGWTITVPLGAEGEVWVQLPGKVSVESNQLVVFQFESGPNGNEAWIKAVKGSTELPGTLGKSAVTVTAQRIK